MNTVGKAELGRLEPRRGLCSPPIHCLHSLTCTVFLQAVHRDQIWAVINRIISYEFLLQFSLGRFKRAVGLASLW